MVEFQDRLIEAIRRNQHMEQEYSKVSGVDAAEISARCSGKALGMLAVYDELFRDNSTLMNSEVSGRI